ncbi:MAG: hypothetical protein ABW099_00065, partial [Candidatus Binatia bacterium]
MKRLMALCSLLIPGFLLTQPVDSQTDFFQGKHIQNVGGFTVGGIIDPWARREAQYLGDLVVQNIAASGSMRAPNTPEPTACGIVTA